MMVVNTESTELVIKKASRKDTGEYKVKLVNSCGECEVITA